jgi:hypothetical protein
MTDCYNLRSVEFVRVFFAKLLVPDTLRDRKTDPTWTDDAEFSKRLSLQIASRGAKTRSANENNDTPHFLARYVLWFD